MRKLRLISSYLVPISIRMIGERAGKLLADHFHSIDALMNATTAQLLDVTAVGPKVAEAITFFQKAAVGRIMLNTQDDNVHAHRLYEWFGFVRLRHRGFVLRKVL